MKTVYLYLKSFSGVGGVEKVSKVLSKALSELTKNQISHLSVLSAYDQQVDARYVDRNNFKGYGGGRVRFFLAALYKSYNANTLLLAHINLAPIALVVKLLNPSIKVILIAHGIEVWRPLGPLKRLFLERCDTILAVSQFTQRRMKEVNPGIKMNIQVLNNALDPYFKVPSHFSKPEYLQERYKLASTDQVLLTLTRMNAFEKFKGYDQVIEAIAELKNELPMIKYLLAGKCDEMERVRLTTLIQQLGVQTQVQLTGFISDEELTDHFLLADTFIMPSKKEGFGIVFIEALACGLPVIAGNKDGSVDAVKNGKLGMLIDPDSTEEIKSAILQSLNQSKDTSLQEKANLSNSVIEEFSFIKYCKTLSNVIGN